ncbi:hypothetical protein TUM3792_36430 [Shewanella sp. MBTL60-007]|nr:hypothetical protein TUM3792_36430 [Shewanella sp. MBTL60-007]
MTNSRVELSWLIAMIKFEVFKSFEGKCFTINLITASLRRIEAIKKFKGSWLLWFP